MALMICALLAFAALSVALKNGPVELPQAKAIIEDALNSQIAGQDVGIGSVALTSGETGTGNLLQLRNVTLQGDDGTQLLKLADVRTSFSWRDLVLGRLAPSEVTLVGTEVRLRREKDGSIAFLSVQSADDDTSLIDAVEALVARPEFAALDRVDLSGATLLMTDAATGQSWSLDDTELSLSRSDDDKFTLNAAVSLSEKSDNSNQSAVMRFRAEGAPGDEEVSLAFQFEEADPAQVADLFLAFDWLRNFDTRISGSIRAKLGRDGQVGGFAGVLDLGQGRITGTPDSTPLTFSHAKVYFSYDQATEILNLEQVVAETSSGTLTGEGFVTLNRQADGRVNALAGQLRFGEIVIDRKDIFADILKFDGAAVDARLSFDPLRLELGQLSIFDGDATIRVSGQSTAGEAFWTNRYDVDVSSIEYPRLVTLWPHVLEPKTRRWLVENVHEGRAVNFRGGMRSEGGKPAFAFQFDAEEVRATFLETLPDLRDGRGYGLLTQDEFRLDISHGHVLAADGTKVAVAGSSLYIPNINLKPTPGEIRLKASSGLQAALHLLNAKKFRFLDKVNLTPEVATGRALVDGVFRLPLNKNTKFDQVKLDVNATLFDLASDTLVDGRKLRGDDITVKATETGVSLDGEFTLDGVPVAAKWTQPFGDAADAGSTIAARLALNDKNLRAFGIGLPKGSVSGAASGQLDITLTPGKPPKYALASDLKGARLAVSAIGWSKPAKAAGKLRLAGSLGDAPTVDRFELTGGGLSTQGRLELNSKGALTRAVFSSLKIGKWIDAQAVMRPRGANSTDISLTGKRLDLRNFNPGKGSGGAGNSRITVKLDRLIVTREVALTQFSGKLSTAGGLRGNFTARVNGGTPIAGQVFPQAHGTALELTSNDAGGILRSAKLLDNARGGDLRVVIVPRPGKSNYDGTMQIKKTRLRNASAMADLLNAISLVGLLQQLNGSGIHFTTVDGQFALRDGAVQLKNVAAVGPSMGLTLDGWYNAETRTVDFEGVTTPLYVFNGMMERIFGPLVGRRKGEGMFSFTYRMRGRADNPKVSVNPLSILTPGAFREVFRQNAPKPPKGFASQGITSGPRVSTKTPQVSGEEAAPEQKSAAEESKKLRDELR
ncbi:MAG: AsmA-like C-terminal region-containing protein [Pseudomonadota bacterium]